MQPRTRRTPTPGKRKWSALALLTLVVLAALVVAAPAVARPAVGHSSQILSTHGVIAVICLAAAAACLLVVVAVMLGERERETEGTRAARARHAGHERRLAA